MSARLAASALVAAVVLVSACSDHPSPTSPSASVTIAASRTARAARSGALQLTKDCTGYNGGPGQTCLIKTSSVAALDGGTIVYELGAVGTIVDTDITIFAPGRGHNRAFGHCNVDLATGTGVCRLAGGTGTLAGIHATVDVTPLGWPFFAWSGQYRFGGRGD